AECLCWLPGRGRVTALATRVVAAAVLAAALYRGYAAGVEHEYLGIGFDPSFAPRKPDAVRHPYPLAPAVADSNPPIMKVLRRPGGPLLELPANPPRQTGPPDAAVPRGPYLDARAMYRSTYHWRPLLNGYSSYWPPGYVERMTLAQELPDPAALATLRRGAGPAPVPRPPRARKRGRGG